MSHFVTKFLFLPWSQSIFKLTFFNNLFHILKPRVYTNKKMVHSSLEISTLKSYLLFFSSFFSSSEIRSSPYRLPSLSSPLFTSPLTHIFNRSEYLLSEKQIRSFLWFSNNPPPVIEDTLPPFTLFFLLFFSPSPSSIDWGGKHEGKRKDEEQKEVEGGDGNEPGEEDRIGFAPRKRNLPSVFHGQRGRFEGRVKIQGCCYVALDPWSNLSYMLPSIDCYCQSCFQRIVVS